MREYSPRKASQQAFYGAKHRCINPNRHDYKYYGGRGVCFRFATFAEFLNEIGPKPSPDHSLDRINNDGHYEPGNVRWATKTEQVLNQRRLPSSFYSAIGRIGAANAKAKKHKGHSPE